MQATVPKNRKGYLGALALILVIVGLYWGLIHAPPDAYQGNAQRIMYLHIPSILTAYLSFFLVFVGSCLYLWKREKRDDILAHSAAEIGVLSSPRGSTVRAFGFGTSHRATWRGPCGSRKSMIRREPVESSVR